MIYIENFHYRYQICNAESSWHSMITCLNNISTFSNKLNIIDLQ